MIRNRCAVLLGLVAVGSVACSEIGPTGVDQSLLPEEPVTVEVLIPWEQFGSGLATFGGFGTNDDLGIGVAAHMVGDSLEARTLVKLLPVPTSATVRDTTGTARTDTLLKVLRGRLVAVVDTLDSVVDGPVTLQVGMVGQEWSGPTATWDLAVDTAGTEVPWTEAGAGPVANAFTTTWNRSAGDSVFFELDSAGVALWSDTSSVNQGIRLEVLSAGARLEIDNFLLQVDVQPSLNPDTTFTVVAGRSGMTFIYTPEAPAPDGALRMGGTPSWRTVLDIGVPATLNGPKALCDAVGCPVSLTAGRVNYAALVLTTKAVTGGFAPSDSINLDVRPVFDRSTLPKSPLGASLLSASFGKRIAPELFRAAEGTTVEVPITSFVRTLLQPDTAAALPPPKTLALLSIFEPISFAYADFFGPGSPSAPMLKLVVTVGRAVELP